MNHHHSKKCIIGGITCLLIPTLSSSNLNKPQRYILQRILHAPLYIHSSLHQLCSIHSPSSWYQRNSNRHIPRLINFSCKCSAHRETILLGNHDQAASYKTVTINGSNKPQTWQIRRIQTYKIHPQICNLEEIVLPFPLDHLHIYESDKCKTKLGNRTTMISEHDLE